MRIIHVVRQYSPSVGGMETVVENIARHQKTHCGHDASVVTLDRVFTKSDALLPSQEEVDGVPVVRLPYYGSRRYPLCPTVLRHTRGADLIHVHGIDFFFDYLAATRPFHGTPMVASTHGGFFHTKFLGGLKKTYFRTISRASCMAYRKVIATSDNDGAIFRQIIAQPKLEVIENGVDVAKYRLCASRQPRPVLIYFGRWSANKGLQETIEFFSKLHAADPSWKLIIAGREYDLNATDLSRLSRRHGVEKEVDVIPNPSDAELRTAIGRASYFICTSRHEGFGLAPIEAMSAGLVPLLSDIPPFRKLISECQTGFLIEPADAMGSIRRLQTLHRDDDQAHARRRDAMQAFVARYGWKSVVEKYEKSYAEVL